MMQKSTDFIFFKFYFKFYSLIQTMIQTKVQFKVLILQFNRQIQQRMVSLIYQMIKTGKKKQILNN